MSIPYDPEHITYFAETDYRNEKKRFGIKSRDRTRHMYVIGKSGVGKSTLLENMAIQDIQRGEGVAVLDPHGSFADKMLDYVPEHRIKDVIYFAPFDTENPISFNVLEDVGPDRRHLVVSGLMSTFKKIWVDAWSARMEYILTNTLLALLEYPDATLLGVNRMLSDKTFRKKVVENITDAGVKAFWTNEFANYTERMAAEAVPAIQNKIGQFTGNPLVRNIIGQPKSTFDIRKVMDEQKILIINLSKGRIGDTNTSLLGSMIITKIYLAAMSRAEVSAGRSGALPNFYFYVDEFQSFANETFADILAEARKYKLALIIAHQYVAQMEEKVRDAVFGNVGTTVSFRVGPLDGELLEKVFAPQFSSNDLINLGMAQIYLSLMINDIGSAPFSARTLPPLVRPTVSLRNDVIEYSRSVYSQPKELVETNIRNWLAQDAEVPEEKGQKKLRFADGQPPADLKKPFTVGATTYYPPGESPAPRPSLAKPQKETVKPFEKAFAKTVEREERQAHSAAPASRAEPSAQSPGLRALLDAFDGGEPKQSHEQPPVRQPQPAPRPEKPFVERKESVSVSSALARPPRTAAPFDDEKPLRETVPPVKMAERGPTEKNRDLLRSVLQKAGVQAVAKPAAGTPAVPAAAAPSVAPAPAPTTSSEERQPFTSPNHKAPASDEVSSQTLRKILE